jgi:DNA gyrase subunit A
MKYITAPDFPTGGIIYGHSGIQEASFTGRGRIVVRAKAEIVTSAGGKDQIIVTEIPYMVNKAMMIEKTAALVNEKRIEVYPISVMNQTAMDTGLFDLKG